MRIGIVGGGAWGTALALVAARRGHDPVLWAREAEVVSDIATRRENSKFLPGIALSEHIRPTADIAEATKGHLVLLAAPAQHLRAVAMDMRPHLGRDVAVVLCAKGIENGSLRLMTEIAAEILPDTRLAVLSGPTFAREVALGLPTAVTVASKDIAVGQAAVETLGGPTFRPYLSDDPVGAEIGGAVKNVIAIACGIVQGMKLGDNARAALITRGLAEIMRLGRAKGAKAETLMGLSGLGDLTLTCNGPLSRNLSVGVEIGRGRTLGEAIEGKSSIAEGVATAPAVVALAAKLGVDLPISGAVAAILHRGADVRATVDALLGRPFKSETA
jgi:glycerol-3-phosphate dehydrogenase (NAD(P)+)